MSKGKIKPTFVDPATIDPEQVSILAGMNCSLAEIAAVVKTSESTLKRRFDLVIEQGRLNGKASLKRRMWQCAMGRKEKKTVLVKVKREIRHADGRIEKIETQEPVEFDAIIEPNAGMLQWLSKQMLGYSDKVETQNLNQQTGPIKHEWVITNPDSTTKLEDFYDDPPSQK